MANDKAVSLKQLKTSITKLKEYTDNNFSTVKHKHNDIYYTKTEVDNLTMSSDSIVDLKGYVVPEESSPILSTDSLNVAIGKLEKALENVSSKGDIEKANKYTDDKIAEVIGEAPEELSTLADLASAVQTLTNRLDTWKHKTGDGNNHIPSGGEIGQILRNVDKGTAGWVNIEDAAKVLEANNEQVKDILNDIFK